MPPLAPPRSLPREEPQILRLRSVATRPHFAQDDKRDDYFLGTSRLLSPRLNMAFAPMWAGVPESNCSLR
jgi:hypothetical protein